MFKTVKAMEVSEFFSTLLLQRFLEMISIYPTQAVVNVFVYSMPTLRSTSVTMSYSLEGSGNNINDI